MGDDSYWNKLFVADPDFVLASKAQPEQRLAASRRAEEAAQVRAEIDDGQYQRFVQPDALPGAPVVYRRRQQAMAAAAAPAAGAGQLRDYDSEDDNDDVVVVVPAQAAAAGRGRGRGGRGRGALPRRRIYGDIADGDDGVGQRIPADEAWPVRPHDPPAAPTTAVQRMLIQDRAYFDLFGAYMSATMMAATKSVVADIRVLDTLSRNIRHIPIRRLVAEPLVSTWFATWIATKILINRALSGKTWHKDVIIASIGSQVDDCRAFFRNPVQFTGTAQIFAPAPLPNAAVP